MLKGKKYSITRRNIMAHELIGLKARVIDSYDKGRIAMKGTIIDETRNTLVLETSKGQKILPKAEVRLQFTLGEEKVEIDGKTLVERPENRTKAFWRKKR